VGQSQYDVVHGMEHADTLSNGPLYGQRPELLDPIINACPCRMLSMGLLDRLRSSKPDVAADAPTLYQAEIATNGGEMHTFSYLVESTEESTGPEVTIVYNERQFVMPKGATFEVAETSQMEWDGQAIPVKAIVPVRPDDVPEEKQYTPPDVLLGQSIPAVHEDNN